MKKKIHKYTEFNRLKISLAKVINEFNDLDRRCWANWREIQRLKKENGLRDEKKMKNIHFELIQNLRDRREALGITQTKIAILMDTKPSVIARLEKKTGATHSPTLKTVIKYLKAIGYELDIKKSEA